MKIIDYIYSKSQNISFAFSSERTINRGYWASMVDICKKINDSTDNEIRFHLKGTSITTSYNINYIIDDWARFYIEKITSWKKLFTRKLCNVEHHNEELFDENEHIKVIILLSLI